MTPYVSETLSPLGTVTAFRGLPYELAMQPCVTYGSPGGEFVISRPGSTTPRLREAALAVSSVAGVTNRPAVLSRKVAYGTADMTDGPAMTRPQPFRPQCCRGRQFECRLSSPTLACL